MKRFFDFSNGFFHKGVAHLYALVAALLYVVSMILLITTPRVGSLSIALINVIIIPAIITAVLSIFTLVNGNEKMFRVYSIFTIGYAVVDGVVLTGITNILSIEAVQKFFEYSTLVVSSHKNILPAIALVVSISIALIVIGIVFNIIALVLVIRNIKPAPRRVAPVIVTPETLEEKTLEIESETEVE